MSDDELMELMKLASDCGVVCDQLWGDEYIATCSVAGLSRFAAEIERRTLERAALVCDEQEDGHDFNGDTRSATAATQCAAAIRALVTK